MDRKALECDTLPSGFEPEPTDPSRLQSRYPRLALVANRHYAMKAKSVYNKICHLMMKCLTKNLGFLNSSKTVFM
jgi:hypothetical protein